MPTKKTQAQPKKLAHRYTNVREAVVADAGAGIPKTYDLIVGPDGSGYFTSTLSPRGIVGVRGAQSGAAAGSTITWYYQSLAFAQLSWLYSTSQNFEMYRVTRATLIVVGNLGSNATGRVAVVSSPDGADYSTGDLTFPMVAGGGRVFEVGQLASKDGRLPLDIDSSWKRVSQKTVHIADDGFGITPISTFNDLAFTKIAWRVVGAPANSNVATFTIEYDVEFKNPIIGGNA